MSLYSEFVRQNIHSVPGATQTERMRNVAKLWQQHKAGKAGKAPRKRTKRGKGASDAAAPPLADPADPSAAVAAQEGGCCGTSGGGRRRRKRGGDIVAPAAPIQWSGGALNPLAPGNLGQRPSQLGFGVFSDILSSVGLGFRGNTSNNEEMHRSEPGPTAGGGLVSDFVHDAEVAFDP